MLSQALPVMPAARPTPRRRRSKPVYQEAMATARQGTFSPESPRLVKAMLAEESLAAILYGMADMAGFSALLDDVRDI